MAVLLLLLVSIFATKAQNRIDYKNLTHKSQIRFWLSPLLFNQLSLEHQGEILLNSKPTFSFELGVGYSEYLAKNVSLNLGAGWGIIPFQYEYNFNAKMTNNLVETNQHDLKSFGYHVNHYIFPLSIRYDIKNNKFLTFDIEAGLRLNSFLNSYKTTGGASYYIDQNNPDIKLFEFQLENNYQKNFISYFAKIGLSNQTKKLNTLNANIIINYCPQKIGMGYYRFYNLPFESKGQTSLGINFIGLELSYGLTLTKRFKRETLLK